MDKVSKINTLVRTKTRNDLVAMCKDQNLPCTGTKHEMAVRLLGGLSENKPPPSSSFQKIVVKKKGDHWVFKDLVVEYGTKNVLGRLLPDGSVGQLQRAQIETCKQYKFQYILPEILDERPDPPERKADSSDEEYEDEEEEVEGDEF